VRHPLSTVPADSAGGCWEPLAAVNDFPRDDAPAVIDALIADKAIRRINFTGSTRERW